MGAPGFGVIPAAWIIGFSWIVGSWQPPVLLVLRVLEGRLQTLPFSLCACLLGLTVCAS